MIGHAGSFRLRVAVDLLALISGVALILSGWALYSRLNETNGRRAQQAALNQRLLRQDKRQVELIRKVLCLAQDEVLVDPDISATRKRRSVRFYARALDSVGAKRCPIKKKE